MFLVAFSQTYIWVDLFDAFLLYFGCKNKALDSGEDH